jgi:beta-fructofuranosidase
VPGDGKCRRHLQQTGPVLPLPEGYTGHVRDPKVWRHEGRWYMVLGAQDRQKRGKVLLFSSADLHQWTSEGEIAGAGINGLHDAGYMWECPDLFPLGDQHILICCPQGIPGEERYLNTYPAVWMAGGFDYASAAFTHGELHELDAGFEFYAPQTMQTAMAAGCWSAGWASRTARRCASRRGPTAGSTR